MRALRFLAGIAFALAAAPSASAVTWTFTRIVDDAGALANLPNQAAINESGVVAFRADFDAGGRGIFTGDGTGAVTPVADTSGGYDDFSTPTINASGDVAFVGILDSGGSGVYRIDGGGTQTIAESGVVYTDFSGSLTATPSINASGDVAFTANLVAGGRGIYVGDGAAPVPIVVEPGPFPNLSAPSLNDLGQVAFWGSNDLQRGSGGPLTDMAAIGDPAGGSTISTLVNPFGTLNDLGQIAFQAGLASGPGDVGIFVSDGTTITSVLTSGAGGIFGPAAINDAGWVAFETIFDLSVKAFTGAGVDTVLAPGVALDGSSVVSARFFSPEGLNDAGQLVVWAELADGRRGLYRADPVPEPAAVLLVVSALLLGLRRGRRPGS